MTRASCPLALAILSAAGILLAPDAAAGQEPWESRLEFGFNGASGNSSFSILRAGGATKHTRTNLFELELSMVVRYGKSNEDVSANDAEVSLKFDWRPEARISPFAFVDASRDEIRRLDFRADGGFGAKWTFTQGERSSASLSGAGIFDHQNVAPSEDAGAATSETKLRWSFRLKGERRFASGATFEHVTFYQPVWDEFGDYVLEITNTLSTSLRESLSLAVEHVYLRDAVPPPGAARDDQKYSVLLRLAI
jgi:hypothetical protein